MENKTQLYIEQEQH